MTPTRFPLAALALALASSSVAAADAIPRYAHVVIVIEENHASSQIIGSSSAPFINALAAGGAHMTQSYGVTHPSQGNYLELFSGSTQGVTNDSVYPHSQFTAPNLGAKLLAAGLTFGGFSETMPSVGYDGASFGSAPATYQRKHNPWVNWQDATLPLPANKLPASVNMPYAGFFPDAAHYDDLPTLSFVIPNQLHDMHDGTVAEGDAWLQSNLSDYADWCLTHDSLLIVTFDEDDHSAGNHIATILYGASILPGQYAQVIDHDDVLRTLEEMYALPHHAGTVSAAAIASIWAPSPWTDAGSGLAGVSGVPWLEGSGTLVAGSRTLVDLSNAAPSATAALFLAFASTPVPFKGGTLLPFPFVGPIVLTTSAAGAIPLAFTMPAGVPSAGELWFQWAVQDAAAIWGVSLSNAIVGVTP